MLVLVLASSLASAADATPGPFLPGATRFEAISGNVGLGGLCTTDAACGPVVQGDFALTRSLVFDAQVPLLFGANGPTAPWLFAGRLDLLDLRWFRLAAFGLGGGQSTWGHGVYDFDGFTFGGAAQVGWDKLHVDASVPLFHRGSGGANEFGPAAFDVAEAGVTLMPGEHHAFRVGMASLHPDLSYRYEGGAFYGELGAVWVGGAGNDPLALGRAQAGLRF